jgi:hypothetical protein
MTYLNRLKSNKYKFLLVKNIWILFIFINGYSFSQSKNSSFFELSSPEIHWIILHPFKAKKAFLISNDALRTTDSICNTDLLDKDKSGGQADAFKHSYWLAGLTQTIGERAAIKLGEAHEKGNYKDYKKNKLEDGFVPDKLSSEMDLYNNNMGTRIALENKDLNKSELIEIIIREIQEGKMKILKKDESGNFLTCEGIVIPRDSLIGKWVNDKCLVSSNDK